MISAILGTPGMGKSLSGSLLIRDLLDSGRRVYSNLHVNDDRENYFYFDTKDYEIIYDLQDGTILFDEGQFLLDSRKWQDIPVEFRFLLQKGRHEGLDFVILTQNINQIDVAARRLLHEATMIMKVITVKYFNFGFFLQFPVDKDNIEKQKIKGLPSIVLADKEDFEYYNSYALRTEKTPPLRKACDIINCNFSHKIDIMQTC